MSFVYFWIALSVPYLQYRGLSIEQALTLMSLYQLSGVILEYPTGVFGDRFGYKLSMVISSSLMGLSMIMLAQSGSFVWYLISLITLSLGNSFSSGNTLGLLNSISSNIRRDTANRSSLAEFVLFLSAVIGTWLGSFSFEFALYLSAGFMLAAVIPILLIKTPVNHETSYLPVTTIIKDSFLAMKSPIVRQMFWLFAIYGGFFFSIKSIFGSFGELYSFNLTTIGWLVGLGGLAKSIASYIYARYEKISKLLFVGLMSLTVLFVAVPSPQLSIVLLLAYVFLVSYFMSHLDGDLHDVAHNHIRASLFSIKRLIFRLFSSIYLFFIGHAISGGNFSSFSILTGLVMLGSIYVTWKYLIVKSVT